MEPTTEQVVAWVRQQNVRRRHCPGCLSAPYHGAKERCLKCGLPFIETTHTIGWYLDSEKQRYLGLTYAQDALGFWRVSSARPQPQCSESAWAANLLIREQMGQPQYDNPIYRSNHTVHPDRECVLWQQVLGKIKVSQETRVDDR